MVDFAPEQRLNELNQNKFPNNEQLGQTLLKEKYLSEKQLDEEFHTPFVLHERLWEVLKVHPEAALLHTYLSMFENHGQIVATAMRETWKLRGETAKPYVVPLQDSISAEDIHFSQDEYGNFGAQVNLRPETIIPLVKEAQKTFPDQKIINLSLQLGTLEFWRSPLEDPYPNNPSLTSVNDDKGNIYYFVNPNKKSGRHISDANGKIIKYVLDDGGELFPKERDVANKEFEALLTEYQKTPEGKNPGPRIKGAYSKEKQNNVLLLNKVAEAFPDSFVAAAAGNYKDDFRNVADQISSRVTVVGQWDDENNSPAFKVYGADIYVPSKELGIASSSQSTGVISAVANSLVNEGISVENLKQTIIKNYCDEVNYQDGAGITVKTHLLNINKFKK